MSARVVRRQLQPHHRGDEALFSLFFFSPLAQPMADTGMGNHPIVAVSANRVRTCSTYILVFRGSLLFFLLSLSL